MGALQATAATMRTEGYLSKMSKLARGLAAGYGAKKLGGGCGCFGILIFILLWWLLGASGIDLFR